MNPLEIANEMETMFGNPLGPKRYDVIKEGIAVIRFLVEENDALRGDIAELVASKLEK